MKWSLLLIPCGFLCLVASVLCGYFAVPPPPEAFVADQDILDFGDLAQVQTVEGAFELTNNYRKPVEIVEILESCGCSEVKVSSRHLIAGQRTTLNATWRTRTSRGERRVSINVVYRVGEEKGTRHLSLAMRANVIPDFDYEPKELVFSGGAYAKKTITVRGGLSKPVEVITAYASHRAFTTFVKGETQVDIEFDPTKWGSAEDALPHVAVRTTSATEPNFAILVKVVR